MSTVSEFDGSGGSGRDPAITEARLNQLIRPRFVGSEEEEMPPSSQRRSPRIRRIGILTSGGDGPGENAAIYSLVKGAVEVYGWQPIGIIDGFRGLLEPEGRIWPLRLEDVEGEAAADQALLRLYGERLPYGVIPGHPGISTLGGNILRSSRTNPVHGDPQAERVKLTMNENDIDALIVLGGNGSMRAANALHRAGVPLVGIPQSIDLDVWGTEHTIGFPSAVAKGAVEIHHFYNTAHSCRRWFLVEVMGQHYGMLTLAIARESAADSVFIEIPRPLGDVGRVIDEASRSRSHGVILFSEGVKFSGEGVSLVEPPRGTDQHGRLLNESGDVVRWLRGRLAELGIANTRSESLGYLLRGADPTVQEILLAQTLANGALGLTRAGQFGKMIGTRFATGSSELTLAYPSLAQVASRQKPAPQSYYAWIRDRLENPR